MSNPYTGSASYWTTTAFDVLGRAASVTLPDNSKTAYGYSTNTVIVTDPTGKQRESTIDAAGRLTVVTEPDVTNSNKLTLNTTYTYTVLDALASVTTPDQSRNYAYDALGRLFTVTTPEGGTTCFGTVASGSCTPNTGYDSFNNLLYRTDARGVVTSYGYDGLNRLNSVSYNVGSTGVPATSTISLTYGLDSSCTSAHGSGCIGQVITMTDGPGSENYTYNSLEQLTQLQKVIGSTTYTTSCAYNLAGELTTITYPSGRSVTQNLDTIGRLSSIVGTLNSVQTTYASGYGYSPANQLTGFQYGNGIYASLGFTSDRLQLNCLDYSTTNRNGTCAHDSSTKFGLDYSYGAAGSNNGQIQGITDRVDNGRSATYAYDGLARLSTAATTGSAAYPAWGLKETYDRYGNRWSQTANSGCTGITCPQPSVSFNLATNHINTSGYGYDANGNMTNDGMNTLVYDAENHAVSGSGSLGSGTYTYDGNGLRAKKVSGSTTTVYIFSGSKVIAEYDNGAAVGSPSREYIYGGSALLAKIDSTGTKYYHQDQLSNRLVTDSSGNTLAQMGHFPFGESWYNSTGDKLLFTTYERDAESGNDYAQARYYVNRLALFSALDPLPGSAMDPQTLNRYDYVRNNPISFVDPTGSNRVKGGGDCNPDAQICGGGPGFAGNDGGNGYCGADSESCGGGSDPNGVPWSFGPGYLIQTTSPLATLAAAQSRYLSIINTGWDPALGINWNNLNLLKQAQAQYDRLSANLLADFGLLCDQDGNCTSADPTDCTLIWGHCNFNFACPDWTVCGPGRYDNGVHIECAADGSSNCQPGDPLIAHDDTASPWLQTWGQPSQFGFSTFFTGNFWVHAGVDYTLPRIGLIIFPQ